MPVPQAVHPASPSRADIEARLSQTFLTLNQIAASLALIERSCSRVLEDLPVDDDEALEHALALRAATMYAQLTLERTDDVSDTLTTVARYLGYLKRDGTAAERAARLQTPVICTTAPSGSFTWNPNWMFSAGVRPKPLRSAVTASRLKPSTPIAK